MKRMLGSGFWPRLVVVLLGAAAYSTSFDGPFIFDDLTIVVDNPHLQQLWPPIEAMRWQPKASTSGRPLVAYSFAVNYAVSELEVWSYHVFNLLVHLGCACLVYGLLRQTLAMPAVPERLRSRAGGLSFFIAAVWTVHPINSESVIYITQRTGTMSAFFMLLSLRLLVMTHRSRRPLVPQALVVFALVLGLLCKEKTAVMPVLLLLYDRTFLAGSFKEAWRVRRGMYLGAAATWGLAVATIFYVDRGGISSGAEITWRYLLTQGGVICGYVGQMVFPYPLSITYSQQLVSGVWESLPWSLLVFLGLVATGVALVRRPVLGFVGAWFYLILSPDSSVIPIVTEVVAERRMYLPGLSVLVLLTVGGERLVWWSRRWWGGVGVVDSSARQGVGASEPGAAALVSGRSGADLLPGAEAGAGAWSVMVGVGVAVTLAFTGATLVRANDYDTGQKIWEQTVRAQPTSGMALNNLAVEYLKLNRLHEVERLITELEEMKPNYRKLPALWGRLHYLRGEFEPARVAYEEALVREPINVELIAAMAAVYLALEEIDLAEETVTRGMRLSPQNGRVLAQLGLVEAARGRHERALAVYLRLLQEDPENAVVMMNMALSLEELGHPEAARKWFAQAVKENDESTHLYRNYADFEAQQGELEEAERLYRAALEINPVNVEAAVGLAMVFRETEREGEAETTYRSAMRFAPDDAILRNNFGVLLADQGRFGEALAQFEQAVMFDPDYAEARANRDQARALLAAEAGEAGEGGEAGASPPRVDVRESPGSGTGGSEAGAEGGAASSADEPVVSGSGGE
ncbi:MAG: tetratricopeptide repeat protein [Planctomycetota bacterium]